MTRTVKNEKGKTCTHFNLLYALELLCLMLLLIIVSTESSTATWACACNTQSA